LPKLINPRLKALSATKLASARKARLATSVPFVEPKVIQSKDGVLETTLQLCLTKSQVAGRVIETGTYKESAKKRGS
jgi:hypothetical protein